MHSLTKLKSAPWFPGIAVAMWLSYLAITIWNHAAQSQMPPIYDALGYLLKGKNFWELLWTQHIFNPFIWPAYRPPGTILMSFPFGYDSVHAFHFRSVIFPIAVCAMAGWIALGSKSFRAENPVLFIALVMAFTSLPVFYQFEPNTGMASYTPWGHVDTFFASVGALAAAASLRSLNERSMGWLLLGVAAASFSLWIKPAGLAVMASNAAIWFAVAAVRVVVARTDVAARDREIRYLVTGTTVTTLLYVLSAAGAAIGGYLTTEVVAYFTTAFKHIGALSSPWSMHKRWSIFESTIGVAFGALCIVGMAGAIVTAYRKRSKVTWLDDAALVGFLGAVGYLVLGLGWWVIGTEGVLARYLYPFLLMFAVALLPSIGAAALRFGRTAYVFALVVGFGSAANIAVLLAMPEPPIGWQKAAGVNLSSGLWNGEVEAARNFLAEKTRGQLATSIYSVDPYPGAYIFESELVFASEVDATKARVTVFHPIDWNRSSAYRFDELLGADYLLVTKLHGARVPDVGATLDTYRDEEFVVRDWVSSLSKVDGVTVAVDRPGMILLKVTDRQALRKSSSEFIKKYRWRAETVAANLASAKQADWWSTDEVATYAKEPVAAEVDFVGTYKVQALSIRRIEDSLKVEVWWEELRREEANSNRFLFFHLLDASGAILHKQQIPLGSYAPPDTDRKWRYGASTFANVFPNAKLASLGFGIYQPGAPGSGLMQADKGIRDWDNKRVVVKLP